jgi:hypothetical protein
MIAKAQTRPIQQQKPTLQPGVVFILRYLGVIQARQERKAA